jgi:hypothetical protein
VDLGSFVLDSPLSGHRGSGDAEGPPDEAVVVPSTEHRPGAVFPRAQHAVTEFITAIFSQDGGPSSSYMAVRGLSLVPAAWTRSGSRYSGPTRQWVWVGLAGVVKVTGVRTGRFHPRGCSVEGRRKCVWFFFLESQGIRKALLIDQSSRYWNGAKFLPEGRQEIL